MGRDFLYGHWVPNDPPIAGFRAPLKLRKNGVVCIGGDPNLDGFASSWVAIESTEFVGALAQVGWDHNFVSGYCRFFEWNDGVNDSYPILSRCNTDADGTTRWFKVNEAWDPDTQDYHFYIYDCGTTDWSSCTALSAGISTFDMGLDLGAADGEANYPGTCLNDYLGTSGQRTLFGGTAEAIKGQHSLSGAWGIKTLVYADHASCSEYVSDSDEHTDELFKFYDTNS